MGRFDGRDKKIELAQNVRTLQLFVIVISIHIIFGIIFYSNIFQFESSSFQFFNIWFPYYCFGVSIIGSILMYREYLDYKRKC